jgi:predicted nucleic acid-binding protein
MGAAGPGKRKVQKAMSYVLDACALLAFLNNEDSSSCVYDLLQAAGRGEAAVSINIINLYEVYYKRIGKAGLDAANEFLNMFNDMAIEVVFIQVDRIFAEAARLKTSYQMSLADSFALATALCRGAALVTADHHEFDVVEQAEPVDFLWIR